MLTKGSAKGVFFCFYCPFTYSLKQQPPVHTLGEESFGPELGLLLCQTDSELLEQMVTTEVSPRAWEGSLSNGGFLGSLCCFVFLSVKWGHKRPCLIELCGVLYGHLAAL